MATEKLSERDHVHPGCTPRDPFTGLPDPSFRKPDVDFHDVFGGPPRARRSSIYERSRSRTDSLDLYPPSRGSAKWTAEEGSGSRLRWPGARPGEKPVFGESRGPSLSSRRHHLGDDFFTDIFPGSDSLCSSPKRLDRDVLSSSPGSRVLSPNRPVLSRHELLAGRSSLPAQLSLSMKFARGRGSPTICSHICHNNEDGVSDACSFPSSPNQFTYTFPTRAIPEQDDLGNDHYSPYHRSSFSSFHSFSVDSKEATRAASAMGSESQKTQTSLESYINGSQFHFSFHRWASKGVSLVLPPSPTGEREKVNGLRGFPEVVIQGIDLLADDDNMSTATGASQSQTENEDCSLPNDFLGGRKEDPDSPCMEDRLPPELDRTCPPSAAGKGTSSTTSGEVLATVSDTQKSMSKNLQRLLNDDAEKQENDSTNRDINQGDGFSRTIKNIRNNTKTKQQSGRESPRLAATSPSMNDGRSPSEDKMLGTRLKGKVKEFIKIFNNDGSQKRKGAFNTQDQRFGGKDESKSRVENQAGVSGIKANEEVRAMQMNVKSAFVITSNEMNDVQEEVERKDAPGPYSECTYDFLDISMGSTVNAEEFGIEDIEGCLIEQLSEYQDQHFQDDTQEDQIKISESKVREWSKGKEGNIRSLLSTLQHVLWPESGWKTVPLVDIIEGAAVKRAYQRALLCLHPDKLQQRGAAAHQKYIAEKVFDVLQEAWIQFSSSSAF